jgi:flagellar hook-basal body complex protein FliE
MSLIDSISGFGGGLFGASRGTSVNTNDASSLLAGGITGQTGSAGGTQDMGSLLKNLSGGDVQNAADAKTSSLLAGTGVDPSASTRSVFAEVPSGNSVFSASSASASGQDAFVSTLNGFINDVNGKGKAAEQANQDILTGKSDNIHQAMISMQEASISFDLLVQVRNKLVSAYQELSRMTV